MTAKTPTLEDLRRIMRMTSQETIEWFQDLDSPIPNLLPLYLGDPFGVKLSPHKIAEEMWNYAEKICMYAYEFFGKKDPRSEFVALMCRGFLPIQASFILMCSMLLEIFPERTSEISELFSMFGDSMMDRVADIVGEMHISVTSDAPHSFTSMLEGLIAAYTRNDPYDAAPASKVTIALIEGQVGLLQEKSAKKREQQQINNRKSDAIIEAGLHADYVHKFTTLILESMNEKLFPVKVTTLETIPITFFFSGLETPDWLINRTYASTLGKQLTAASIRMLGTFDEIGLSARTFIDAKTGQFNTHSQLNIIRNGSKDNPAAALSDVSCNCFEDMCASHANLLLLHFVNVDDTRAAMRGSIKKNIVLKNVKPNNADDLNASSLLPRCLRSSTETLLFRPCFLKVKLESEAEVRLPSFQGRPIFVDTHGGSSTCGPFKLKSSITLPLYILKYICSQKDVAKVTLSFYGNTKITEDNLVSSRSRN